eukprot:superscaffoldBa00007391_g22481
MRLMLMNLKLPMPRFMKVLCSPGLMYTILPLNWGCSNISQCPSITLQDMQLDMRKRSMMSSQSSISSDIWPPKFSLS